MGQRVSDKRDNPVVNLPGIAEPDFNLGWMDIDVKGAGRHLDKKRHKRVPARGNQIMVCLVDGPAQDAVADKTAVQVKELVF